MLSDDLLEDARHLAARGAAETRHACMRRAISTAYYAGFHLFIEDLIEHWEFADQRAQLARMFSHQKMRDASFDAKDKRNPTTVESSLIDVIAAFRQLQADRRRADYDLAWDVASFDVDALSRMPPPFSPAGAPFATNPRPETTSSRCSAASANPPGHQ